MATANNALQYDQLHGQDSPPSFTTTHAFHTAKKEIDDAIVELRINADCINSDHKEILRKLISSDGLGDNEYGITEVHQQYRLVEKIRTQVLDDQGDILLGTSVKDLASLIGALNSLISVYIRSEEKLNKIQEEANLREAVLAALKELPQEFRDKFFETLDGFEPR